MIKITRKPGRKVDFNSKTEQVVLKGKDGIKTGFSEIRKLVNRIKKIDSKLKNKKIKVIEKEELVDEKKENTRKMVDLWNSLKKADLNELRKEESTKIINSQKNFIDDLLKYYKDWIRKRNISKNTLTMIFEK